MTMKRTIASSSQDSDQQVIFLDRDHAIVAGLKRQDPGALSALFDAYATHIQKILVRILGTRHFELDDCLQETFIAAYKKAPQLKEARYLRPWITRIAVNRALDELRKRKRGGWLQFFAPDTLPNIPVDPHRLEDTEALEAAYNVLDALPAKERIVFTLRRLEKMTIAEIAFFCRISQATVKRRISSAERRFEKLLKSEPALDAWWSDNGLRRQE